MKTKYDIKNVVGIFTHRDEAVEMIGEYGERDEDLKIDLVENRDGDWLLVVDESKKVRKNGK